MDDLNKNQLILLALLVSFVTSIATGVATVSLIDQAPSSVTQVINRVVERTVETVTPGPREVVTREETVVVREEEQVTTAIEAAEQHVVRIFDESGDFLSIGLVVNDDGLVATVPNVAAQQRVQIRAHDGSMHEGSGMAEEGITGTLGFMRITEPNEVFASAIYPAPDTLKLGQTVVALSGSQEAAVSIGVLSELSTADENVELETNIDLDSVVPGSVIINLSGEVMGLVHQNGEESIVPFTQIQMITAEIS